MPETDVVDEIAEDVVPEPAPEPPPANWWDEYGVTDEKWLSIISRYATPRDAHDALVELHQLKSKAVSPPSKDLKPDEYAEKVSELRRKVVQVEKPEDYVINIPKDLKDEVLKRKEDFVEDVQKKAFAMASTQAEVDAEIDAAMENLRAQLKKEKDAENESNAVKVRNRQELENVWAKRTDQELENARLIARHYDNTLLFSENQALFSQEELAEKGGYLEQFFTERRDPKLDRFMAAMHKAVLGEGNLVEGTKLVQATNAYKDRLERAKAAFPNSPELWEQIAKSDAKI